MKLLRLSLTISLLFMVSFACAAATKASALLDLKQRLAAIETIQADFKQTVTRNYQDQSTLESQHHGKFWLAKPNRFRWQTNVPDNQLIVADGHSLWVYDQDLEQVTVQNQQHQLKDVPLLLLSGNNDDLERSYRVTIPKTSQANSSYHLQALDPSSLIREITISFTKQTLKGIEIKDSTGGTTKIVLSNSRQNLALSASLFNFKVPKGVDVIGNIHR